MYKAAIILYITSFSIYVLFSRQPDYFDGQLTKATIHFMKDSTGEAAPHAVYYAGKKYHSARADYLFRSFTEGQKVDLIYETSKPESGAVYTFWGYWLRIGELFFSFGIMAALCFIAISVTSNPTPEALMEQLHYKPVKRRKYED